MTRAAIFIITLALLAAARGEQAPSRPASRKRVDVTKVVSTNSETLFVENHLQCKIIITTKLKSGENTKTNKPLPHTISVAPGQKREWITFSGDVPGKRWIYTNDWKWNHGSTAAEHDTNVIYELPYDEGSAFKVTQTFLGRVSHQEAYAVDFEMPEGTPVRAARGGVVCDIVDYNSETGNTEDFKQKGNFIFILHDDGTIGCYFHIQYNGADAAVGERVAAGQRIGRSGNVGFSTGPHLHFSVMRPIDAYTSYSYPIRFRAEEGIINFPELGEFYKAAAVAR